MALIWFGSALALLVIIGLIGNIRIVTTTYETALRGLREPLRIVVLSDVHGRRFGRGDARLLARINHLRPGLIVIPGDLLSRRRNITAKAVRLVDRLAERGVVVISRGNHDLDPAQWARLAATGSSGRVHVLENRCTELRLGPNTLTVAGLDDVRAFDDDHGAYRAALAALSRDAAARPAPRVLLAHRPEFTRDYAKTAFDLSVSGHAHGGQIRLPGVGAIWGPEQGFRPAFIDDMYRLGELTAVVSRGLGPSRFPLRVFNPGEVVVIDCAPDTSAREPA